MSDCALHLSGDNVGLGGHNCWFYPIERTLYEIARNSRHQERTSNDLYTTTAKRDPTCDGPFRFIQLRMNNLLFPCVA